MLLDKWRWKLLVDKSGLWREVELSKYDFSDNNTRFTTSNLQS